MIGRTLSHYRVEDRLGAGGMGVVYLARDLALDRLAALKVLPRGFDPALRHRLMREARACSRLQHPGIATFFEAGEEEGEIFVAMEYVRGRTLRATLREGALPPERAIAVAAALLESLSHAHAAGVLHRDVKPENVMISQEGRVKLLDFGLAKHLAAEESGGDLPTLTLLTSEGAIVGTPGFLAPEQLRGEAADGRADLFAVGAILYEMLSGAPAFPGTTPMARAAAALSVDPPPLRAGGSPAGTEEVLLRALARDPARRYATAGEFLAGLRRLGEGSSLPGRGDRIVVVDFENLSGNPEDEWIGTGISETLVSDLSRGNGLQVVAREGVMKVRAGSLDALDVLAVGQRLGCRWAIGGSYQRVGEALRVTSRLLEVATGGTLGVEKADGTLERVFELQDRLAASVAATLRVRDTPGAPQYRPGAWEAHARGRKLLDPLGKGSFDEAGRHFEEAIALDPRHAGALSGLAMVHAMRFTTTTSPETLDRAADLARRATAADPGLGEAQIWLGYALMRQGRQGEALAALRRAMELDPRNVFAPYFAGCSTLSVGRRQESLRMFQQAIELEGSYGFAWIGLGWTHLELGHLEQARYCFARAEEIERPAPTHPTAGAAGFLGEALRRMNRLEESRAACLRGIEAAERSDHMYRDTFRAISLLGLGRTSLRQGDHEGARAAFRQAADHLRGRDRTLGGGHLLVQALAGLAQAGGGSAVYEEARSLFQGRGTHDFSWFWSATDDYSLLEMARAARALGRRDEVMALLERARQAGAGPVTAVGEGSDENGA